ncbi:hypothetical protein [Natronosalvus rutilus]|uniref:Uncharacterized protein n=1 Tax=Natronosalvus rutilus TaxID=2953753 RepID=A0A9E7N790_9EURY|nr:hypothetical protein [Natronosalvus rutilus]UTF52111.1 hypothetical protein NGM29_09875 [Natronosalvus rutilus]
MPTPESPTLEGTLVALPYPRHDLLERVADEYAALVESHGSKNVLVLKRHPAGFDRLERVLLETIDDPNAARNAVSGPRVESLPEHASKVLETYDPTLERLEYEERIELISLVVAGASLDVPPYLERASEHDSFARDVGRLLLEATRQQFDATGDRDGDAIHPCLAFLYAMNDRFHDELDSRGFVERADVIPRVVDLLEADADGLRERTTDSFDAVLAVQFEEFRRLDRRYLAALTGEADLVCVGQRHASVERTRVEPGSLESIADGLEVRPPTRQPESKPAHDAITRVLATGTVGENDHDQYSEAVHEGEHEEDDEAEDERGEENERKEENEDEHTTARAYRLRTETARAQVRWVASEIQSLRDRFDWSFDEFAVAVPRAEHVPRTRRLLRDVGVPTATIGTPSLADDPAVSELYAVIEAHCTLEQGHDPTEIAEPVTARLEARIEEFSPRDVEAAHGQSVTTALESWIQRTNVKARIARDEPWIDAREQFQSIRRVLEIARFVERTDLVAPDWQGLRRMLQRTIEYDAPHVHAIETRAPGGGVTVCPVDELAYDSREVVFLVDLIDDTYPGTQFLTPLFPTAWLRSMPSYPAVTDPSSSTLEETFATVTDGSAVADRFETYHAERARRRLALGSRAARTRLYCCSYERETEGLRRTHDESRFVRELTVMPGIDLEPVNVKRRDHVSYGRQRTLEAALEVPWTDLETLLGRASIGEPVDLDATAERIQELALALEHEDVDETIRDAVYTQFEFAAGEVSR